jgi:hypothetical protein
MADKAKKNRDAEDVVDNDSLDSRTRLVRVPRIVDSSIFGGWGIKI